MSRQPSPGGQIGRMQFKAKPHTGGGLTQGAEDAKYHQKYKELKRKVKEIESDNDKLHYKVLQAKRNIQRMKLERAILYDRLSQVPPSPEMHDRPLPQSYHVAPPPEPGFPDYLRSHPPPSRGPPPPEPSHDPYLRSSTSGARLLPMQPPMSHASPPSKYPVATRPMYPYSDGLPSVHTMERERGRRNELHDLSSDSRSYRYRERNDLEREWDRDRRDSHSRDIPAPSHIRSPPNPPQQHRHYPREDQGYYHEMPAPSGSAPPGYAMHSRSETPGSGSAASGSGPPMTSGEMPSRPDSRDQDRPRSYRLRPVTHQQQNDDIDFVHEDGRRDHGGGGVFTSSTELGRTSSSRIDVSRMRNNADLMDIDDSPASAKYNPSQSKRYQPSRERRGPEDHQDDDRMAS